MAQAAEQTAGSIYSGCSITTMYRLGHTAACAPQPREWTAILTLSSSGAASQQRLRPALRKPALHQTNLGLQRCSAGQLEGSELAAAAAPSFYSVLSSCHSASCRLSCLRTIELMPQLQHRRRLSTRCSQAAAQPTAAVGTQVAPLLCVLRLPLRQLHAEHLALPAAAQHLHLDGVAHLAAVQDVCGSRAGGGSKEDGRRTAGFEACKHNSRRNKAYAARVEQQGTRIRHSVCWPMKQARCSRAALPTQSQPAHQTGRPPSSRAARSCPQSRPPAPGDQSRRAQCPGGEA